MGLEVGVDWGWTRTGQDGTGGRAETGLGPDSTGTGLGADWKWEWIGDGLRQDWTGSGLGMD